MGMSPLHHTSSKINALTLLVMLVVWVVAHGNLRYVLAFVMVLTIIHILYCLKTGRWMGQEPSRVETFWVSKWRKK